MDAAHLAAQTIGDAFAAGDFSEKMMKKYHDRWMKLFGRDFFWSKLMVKFYAKYPIFLDAYVNLAQKRGSEFLADWGKVMTGAEPKTYMFRPQLALPIAVETGRLWWERAFRRAAA
jgi:flavin-dependent dehydrogenase